MKVPLTYFFYLLLLGCLTTACSGIQSGQSGRQLDYSTMATLADALRVQGGVQVVGSGTTSKVLIRGINNTRSESGMMSSDGPDGRPQSGQGSMTTDTEPLFVIDGTPVGNSYASAADAVNVQNITSIKILKSYSQTNNYGDAGKNGVILIETNLNNN